jgi:hypothetical protein
MRRLRRAVFGYLAAGSVGVLVRMLAFDVGGVRKHVRPRAWLGALAGRALALLVSLRGGGQR